MSIRSRALPAALASCFAVFLALPAGADPATGPGDTAWALPGIVRVGVPATAAPRVAVAGNAGYGYTESQRGEGAHHRAFGSAAVGVSPLRELELSLRFDGRFDAHPDDGEGAHGGMVGDPRLLARFGTALTSSFHGGLEAVVWAPGEDAPSVAFDAVTVDAKLLAAYRSESGVTLGAHSGFRLDRSANATPDLSRLRPGDRLSLGLSDSNAVLLGAGLSYPVGSTEILGEVTADLLVGSKAPDLAASPIRVSAGARHALTRALAFEGLLEVSPSARPDLGAGDPLVPVEPLLSIVLGVRYRFQPAPAPERTKEPPPELPPPVAPPPGAKSEEPPEPASVEPAEPSEPEVPPGEIRGLIRSFAGKGVAASIRVEPLGVESKSDAEGQFAVEVPPGDYEVVVTAAGYKQQRRKIKVEENGVTILNAELFEEKR